MKEESKDKNTKKEKEGGSSRASKFLNKLDFAKLAEHEDIKNSKQENKEDHVRTSSNNVADSKETEETEFEKNKLLLGIGILAGLMFIIGGIITALGSVDRVADNVVFGEREVFSVFLILIGIIIIACTFAYKFMDKLFLGRIDGTIESYGEASSSSSKNKYKRG
ncbi:MAG: hypothetical protein ACPK7O_01765 [Methanobacterium sp.]